MRNRQLFVVNRCIPTKLFPNSSNEKNFLAILLCDSLPNRFPFNHFKKIVKNLKKKEKNKEFWSRIHRLHRSTGPTVLHLVMINFSVVITVF